jgi:hypothetical protein
MLNRVLLMIKNTISVIGFVLLTTDIMAQSKIDSLKINYYIVQPKLRQCGLSERNLLSFCLSLFKF